MALAEVFERVAGPDAPVEFRAYDGSTAGRRRRAGRGSRSSPRSRSPTWPRRPARSAWPAPTSSGHLDVDGDMYAALARMAAAQRLDMSAAERLRLLRELGGPRLLLPRVPPPPQEVRVNRRWLAGRRHSKGRDASAISHHYDVSNTFYEWVLGPSHGLHLRVLPARGRHAGGGPGVQVRPGRPEARPAARHAAARRRLRLGRHGHARRPRVRGQGARRDPVRAAGVLGAAGDRGRRACPTWPRSATWTTGT